MIKIAIFACALAVASAQYYNCADISGGDREFRTGARVFCFLDVNADNDLLQAEIEQRFSEWSGGADSLPNDVFSTNAQEQFQLCASEGDAFAARIGGLDATTSPDSIEQGDVDAFFNTLSIAAAGGPVTGTVFSGVYAGFWIDIADPTCTIGK